MTYTVAHNILSNTKRMAKIRSLTIRKAREQARRYAIAECQKIGFRATEDDLFSIAALIVLRR